jgi:hypothetical protein
MNNNSLANLYAAAIRPMVDARREPQPVVIPTTVRDSNSNAAAASAVLMAAVRRSLESCRDPSQLRMAQAFAPIGQH